MCYLKKMKVGLWVILGSLLLLTACSSSSTKVKHSYSSSMVGKLQKQHDIWRGTRYKLGGMTRKGIDCSGFTLVTFRDLFNRRLPRTTVLQAKMGRYVSKKSLRAGDLIFFKTGRGPFGRHVGIYIKNGVFLHASTKKGVTYSQLNSPYWKKVYWQARRL